MATTTIVLKNQDSPPISTVLYQYHFLPLLLFVDLPMGLSTPMKWEINRNYLYNTHLPKTSMKQSDNLRIATPDFSSFHFSFVLLVPFLSPSLHLSLSLSIYKHTHVNIM